MEEIGVFLLERAGFITEDKKKQIWQKNNQEFSNAELAWNAALGCFPDYRESL